MRISIVAPDNLQCVLCLSCNPTPYKYILLFFGSTYVIGYKFEKRIKEQGFSVFWSYKFAFKNEVINQFFLTKL